MSSSQPDAEVMTRRFRTVAERVLDACAAEAPEWALQQGDDRWADRLSDFSRDAEVRRASVLTDALGSLDEIDPDLLAPGDLVDLEILRSHISAQLWRTAELRPHTWDPSVHSPGRTVHALVENDLLPMPERLDALTARCAQLPEYLAIARERLSAGPGMPRVHVETELANLEEARELFSSAVPALGAGGGSRTEAACAAALTAVEEHTAWLRGQLDTAFADPRLGERIHSAQLWYTLDSEMSAQTLLLRAESDLLAVEESIAEVAAEYEDAPRRPQQVFEVLSALAASHPVDDAGIRPTCENALTHLYERVRDLDLVTVHDDPVRVVSRPATSDGTTPVCCEPPGPLAPRVHELPVDIAVRPPSWDHPDRQALFREYNGLALRNLVMHKAVPGHALQFSHATRHRGETRVRTLLHSDSFVGGWALHAGERLATLGWDGGEGDVARRADLELRLAQLKTRLRTLIDTILDVRVHTKDITKAEAITLMTERGHQERPEALDKWRRVQLGAAQLSTHYAGHLELSETIRVLATERPEASERELHDAMLAHGAPPPRHLRTLLGSAPDH